MIRGRDRMAHICCPRPTQPQPDLKRNTNVHLTVVESDNSSQSQVAALQRRLIKIMCADTGLTMSGLAAEAGVHNSTVTRHIRLGRPNKWDTFDKLIQAYFRIMQSRDRKPSPEVVRYARDAGGEGAREVDDITRDEATNNEITAERLKLAISIVNDEFGLGMNEVDISDMALRIPQVYPMIVAEERATGTLPSNDRSGWAKIKRREVRSWSGR
jgi:hypothetical protein